jgi:hypothetical protein
MESYAFLLEMKIAKIFLQTGKFDKRFGIRGNFSGRAG